MAKQDEEDSKKRECILEDLRPQLNEFVSQCVEFQKMDIEK